jgi:ribosomal protein L24E
MNEIKTKERRYPKYIEWTAHVNPAQKGKVELRFVIL